MMLGHVKLIDDSLQMRSCSLDGQDAFLLQLAVRHTSMLHVPSRIFKNAIRLPHVNKLLTDCPRGAVISEAVPNSLDQVASMRSDMLRESI